MKHRIFWVIVIILGTSAIGNAKELIELGSPSDLTSHISGLILVEAYKRFGIKATIEKLPAERSLMSSNEGLIDGEVVRIKGIDKKYTNLIRIQTPINYFEETVFSNNHHFTVKGWESHKPYSIAIRIGIKYAEEMTKGMRVAKFVSTEKIFMLVEKSRYDICLSSRINGLY